MAAPSAAKVDMPNGKDEVSTDPVHENGSVVAQESGDGVHSEDALKAEVVTGFTPVLDPIGVSLEKVYGFTGTEGPPEDMKRKIFSSILHQITVERKPVYRCQLPIFCLEPRSFLERLTDFFAYSHILLGLDKEPSAEQRFLGIVKFFLSAWHLQIPKGARVRNPLNPILGEVYRVQFGQGEDRMDLLCEQITHHPPSSAFAAWNKKNGLSMEAYIRPDVHFSGNIVETHLIGDLIGNLYNHKERYVLSYPKYLVHGVLWGTMQMELGGKSTVECEKSGYMAEIEFKSTGQMSSEMTSVIKGKVWHVSDEKKILYHFSGNWDSEMFISSDGNKTTSLFLDVRNEEELPKHLPADAEQFSNESRQVWGQVASEIRANDEPNALKHKTAIEEHQRALASERKKTNATWEPKYFRLVRETWRYPGLRDVFGLPDPELDPTPVHHKAPKEKSWFRKAFGGK